jgi:hypothetical protein
VLDQRERSSGMDDGGVVEVQQKPNFSNFLLVSVLVLDSPSLAKCLKFKMNCAAWKPLPRSRSRSSHRVKFLLKRVDLKLGSSDILNFKMLGAPDEVSVYVSTVIENVFGSETRLA